jgi:hypothetical protein
VARFSALLSSSREGYLVWSFAYLAVQNLFALVWLLARPRRSNELEMLVLRHELAMSPSLRIHPLLKVGPSLPGDLASRSGSFPVSLRNMWRRTIRFLERGWVRAGARP